MSTLLQRERQAVAAHARRLVADGLAVGTSGNISARRGDRLAITPRGVDYDRLDPGLVCVVSTGGDPVACPLAPSTELPLHREVYAATGAGAVVHTHSPYATVLATVAAELPPVHYLVATLGGPIRVAPYATPGSQELADHVATALAGRSAALLGNHGAVTIGDTLEEAYARAVLLEWLAALYYRARLLGEPRLIDPAELDRVGALLEHYLQR
ncbi:MAG TPA: class II aldolase/adducin family protein [Actinomycetota bacterium]|nr:class II aldolase/adducin family protein [Actinomycetota bacterium]